MVGGVISIVILYLFITAIGFAILTYYIYNKTIPSIDELWNPSKYKTKSKNRWNVPTMERMLELRQMGDPLADEVMSELKGLHPRYGFFLEKVKEKAASDPQSKCARFLAHVHQIPSWVNFDKMLPAVHLFQRYVLVILLGGFGTLIESYGWGDGSKVLDSTKRLSDVKQIRKRHIETAKFTLDIMTTCGKIGSDGFNSALQVRLLHAWVRAHVKDKYPDWDSKALGHPANQLDMAHTLCLFSHASLRNAQLLGIAITAEEKESYHHLWRYIGFLMGCHPDSLSHTYSEEIDLYDLLVEKWRIPSDESITLTSNNIKATANNPPLYFPESLMIAITRYLIGESLADGMKVPKPSLVSRTFMNIMIKLFRLHGALCWASPSLNEFSSFLQWRLVESSVEKELRSTA